MLTILSFIAVIIIVVSIHEGGHYLAARACGVRVLRFSVGFGKPLLMKKDKHGTEWVLAPIPLGGYVRMFDKEAGSHYPYPDSERLESCPQWKRIIIYFAGPFANFVLSLLALMILLAAPERGLAPLVGDIRPNTPAAVAGMASGETLASINAERTPLWRYAELAMVDALLTETDITLAADNDNVYIIPPDEDALGAIERGESALAAIGVEPFSDYIKPEVEVVLPNSPAALGGVEVGDRFVAVNDEVLDKWPRILKIIQDNPNKPVTLIMWRDTFAYTTTITLAAVKRQTREIGRLGIAPVYDRELLASLVVTVDRTFSGWLADSFRQAFADISRTISFLRLLVVGRMSTDNLSGPIGIAVHSGEAAAHGFASWLRFLALISTSLGVLNLLPLPVLDGGHIFVSVVQIISRREIPEWLLRRWDTVGMALLLMLTVWVIFNDIARIFG